MYPKDVRAALETLTIKLRNKIEKFALLLVRRRKKKINVRLINNERFLLNLKLKLFKKSISVLENLLMEVNSINKISTFTSKTK